MFNLKVAMAGILLFLAAVAYYQYQRIQILQLIIVGTESRITSLEAGLSTLKRQDTKNRASIEKLLTQQDQISQHQVEQQHAFTRLQNEYATVKDWSDVLLPAELTGMLQRPAQTGYTGGGAAVRAGDALPATRSAAPKNR